MKTKHIIQSRGEMLALLILLPLLGVILGKQPLERYLEFPTSTQYVDHAVFSWPIFLGLALVIAVVVVPFIAVAFRRPVADLMASDVAEESRRFPVWGWMGLLWTGLSWVVAWTRFDLFESVQIFTFTPLWLGYIVVVNAWTYKRTRRCMLTHRPGYMALLFLVSAAFWWYFEYLNRFVQNWFYHGIDGLSAGLYLLFATPPFATVLPAVLGTFEALKSGSQHGSRLDRGPRIRLKHPEWIAWAVGVLSSLGLFAVGLHPNLLFPLLWVAPLLIITSIQCIQKERTLFAPLAEGRWRDLYLLALSALICGFFWELWNAHSLAQWTYSVPFVQSFHLFEMPILGYAGYLPFGLECAVLAHLFLKPRDFRNVESPPEVPAKT